MLRQAARTSKRSQRSNRRHQIQLDYLAQRSTGQDEHFTSLGERNPETWNEILKPALKHTERIIEFKDLEAYEKSSAHLFRIHRTIKEYIHPSISPKTFQSHKSAYGLNYAWQINTFALI